MREHELLATQRRLRDLNGVLDQALLRAVDVIVELSDDSALSKLEWQRLLIGEAAKFLGEAGLFPGRFSLYENEELELLARMLMREQPGSLLAQEAAFEAARRGIVLDARGFEALRV